MFQNYFLTLLDWWRVNILLKNKKSNYLFKEGDIWWCSIGINIGVEIFGKGKKFARPVIIFKKFDGNSFLGIPLTTQPKMGIWHTPFVHADKKQYAVLSQIRTLDSRQLIQKMGSLSNNNFENIKKCFAELYTPENIHPAPLSSEENDAGIGG